MGECYDFSAFGCSTMEFIEKIKQLEMALRGNQEDFVLDEEKRNNQESHLEKVVIPEIEVEYFITQIEFLEEYLERAENQFRRYSDFDLKKYRYLEK